MAWCRDDKGDEDENVYRPYHLMRTETAVARVMRCVHEIVESSCHAGPSNKRSLRVITRSIDVDPGNLPLLPMLDQSQADCCFCVLELRFRGVEALDPLAIPREVGNARLALHRLGRLQMTKFRVLTKVRVELIDRDRFLQLRAGSVEQRHLTPIGDDCLESSVCVNAALSIELRATVSEKGEANRAKHQQDERKCTATDEELLHL